MVPPSDLSIMIDFSVKGKTWRASVPVALHMERVLMAFVKSPGAEGLADGDVLVSSYATGLNGCVSVISGEVIVHLHA